MPLFRLSVAKAPDGSKGMSATGRENDGPGFGAWLLLWAALTVALHGAAWAAGFPTADLASAIDDGAARVESAAIGEVGDDLIRKAIRMQHDTRPFWTVVAFLGDFLGDPFSLAARAVAAATAFSAAAALRGRTIGYDRALVDCAAAQGWWVAGLAVRVALMAALRRGDVETSAALGLAPGPHHAAVALALRQLDPFVFVGWLTIASGAVRRGQTGWPSAVVIVGAFATTEAVVRIVAGLVAGAGMRLTVMPE
jgi:hypothetical protein